MVVYISTDAAFDVTTSTPDVKVKENEGMVYSGVKYALWHLIWLLCLVIAMN